MRLVSGQRGRQRRARGQSSTIGVTLVLGMVLAGAVATVSLGTVAIQDTQESMDTGRAEKVLTQLDSEIAMVALGNSEAAQLSLPRGQSARYGVDSTAGWLNVTTTNTTTGEATTVMNATMGSIVYENGGRTVAYQGGGVWQSGDNGSAMISPPEFYYRDATLTLPLVTVTGNRSLDGRVAVTNNGTSVQRFPNATADGDFRNPLANGRVNVTVHSAYYRAWGSFFEDRTDGEARYDHANRTATLTLVVPAGPRTVSNAVAATSAGGQIKLAGSGADATRTDSYNSSVGSYSTTATDDGTIRTAGDVTVKGNSVVEGSVSSGGSLRVKGSGEVTGDANYTDSKHITGTVGGEVSQISGVDGVGPIDAVVERRYRNVSETNDNADAGVPITGDALDSDTETLGPGRYHLNRIHLDGGTLTLDTGASGETVVLAVRDYVYLENDARIDVEGTGRVRLYVRGDATGPNGNHVEIDNSGGVVDVADDENATQFWVYGQSDAQVVVDGDSGDAQRFEGVVYAPAGASGSSAFRIDHGQLFGGVVTGTVEMDNGGVVHYDEALRGAQAIPPNENIVRLTYLHISENRVNATDA